jgi:hypothetical protein
MIWARMSGAFTFSDYSQGTKGELDSRTASHVFEQRFPLFFRIVLKALILHDEPMCQVGENNFSTNS